MQSLNTLKEMPKHGDKKVGVCDVHRLVNGDYANREVYYCSDCDAWMCKRCEGDIPKRALAMAYQKGGQLKNKIFG